MSDKIKLITQVRTWSFIICFICGGLLVLGHFEYFGIDKALTGSFLKIIESIISVSVVIGVLTTFIVLINSSGDGLDALQHRRNAKKVRKRR